MHIFLLKEAWKIPQATNYGRMFRYGEKKSVESETSLKKKHWLKQNYYFDHI